MVEVEVASVAPTALRAHQEGEPEGPYLAGHTSMIRRASDPGKSKGKAGEIPYRVSFQGTAEDQVSSPPRSSQPGSSALDGVLFGQNAAPRYTMPHSLPALTLPPLLTPTLPPLLTLCCSHTATPTDPHTSSPTAPKVHDAAQYGASALHLEAVTAADAEGEGKVGKQWWRGSGSGSGICR